MNLEEAKKIIQNKIGAEALTKKRQKSNKDLYS